MRGRKPKPAGMSSRRPQRDEDGPPVRLPRCPSHLQGDARKEWARIGRRLLEAGLLTEIDGAALALYCQAWARWVDAERSLQRYGVVVKSPTGFPMQSPYLAIANKAMEQMLKLLAEFGMSPSSRTRVVATPSKPPRRPLPRHRPQEDPRNVLRMAQ